VVQLFYGDRDYGHTTNGWPYVVATNQPARGNLLLAVPLRSGNPYVGRFRAVNQEGERWSTQALTFPVSAARVNWNLMNGANLALSWPPDYQGWRLEFRTNSASGSLNAGWQTVVGSSNTSSLTLPISLDGSGSLYRLVYP
jgi:hypothetical protein